jgi:hypothetical protein
MATTSTVRIVKFPHLHRIYAPYEAKEVIKAVPGAKWNPDPLMRCWQIPTTQLALAIQFLTRDGWEVQVMDSTVPPRGRLTTEIAVAHTWAQDLLEAAGCGLYEPVFRALTKVLHPDAGGDVVLQQDLNAARMAAQRKCGCN